VEEQNGGVMKNIFIATLLAIISTSAFAQNEKEAQKTIERSLNAFNTIDVGESFVLDIKNGTSHQLIIETIEGFEDYVKTEVESNTLKISSDKRMKQPKILKLIIVSPEINSIKLSGAAEFISSDTLRAESLEIKLTGAASSKAILAVENLKTEISGAGNLTASGIAVNHVSSISGAGDLKAFNLISEKANLTVSGAGDAQVNATKELKVKASGAGDVIYAAEPENLIAEVSGAGEVKKKGDVSVEQTSDTTRIRLGDVKVIIIDESKGKAKAKKEIEKSVITDVKPAKKKHKKIGHWSGFDMGLNAYLTPDNSLNMFPFNKHLELDLPRSLNVSLNFLQLEVPIVKNHISIATGLGLEWQKYAFRNNTTMLPTGGNHIAYLDTTKNYSKTIFRTSWINAPLLLAFNTHKNHKKSFHLATGIIFGYNYSQKAKTAYSVNGDKFESDITGDYGLNRFKTAATVRFGYGKINLFATYQLNQMFKNGAGASLFPVSAGVTLIGF
jgi:hypothetical protein